MVEAQKVALGILKQVMEEKLCSTNVEIVTVTPKEDGERRFTFICFYEETGYRSSLNNYLAISEKLLLREGKKYINLPYFLSLKPPLYSETL